MGFRKEGRLAALCCRSLNWCRRAECWPDRKGACGQATALHLGGRRCATTPLRCSVSWPRRRTRYAPCVRCARTAAASQSLMRAARAATSPALLGTSEARRGLPARTFAQHRWSPSTRKTNARAARGRSGRRLLWLLWLLYCPTRQPTAICKAVGVAGGANGRRRASQRSGGKSAVPGGPARKIYGMPRSAALRSYRSRPCAARSAGHPA